MTPRARYRRRFKARLAAGDPTIRHGAPATYALGCRCDSCRVACVLYRRSRRLPRLVDVVPLREAFERSGETPGAVAARLGWWRMREGRREPDGSRVTRALGLRAHQSRGRAYLAQRTSYPRATALAQAIGVDPVEVGL